MAHYIDKSALVTEIEKRKNFNETLNAHSRLDECNAILSFINTLEAKEVDLDKELSYEDYIRFFEEHPNFSDDWGFDEAWVFAKHFFELGFKAQKGEGV